MTEEEYAAEPYLKKLHDNFVESGRTAPFTRGVARIALTEGCNYDCVFCHNEGMEGVSRQFDLDYLKTILDAYRDQIKSIKLVGGEPLLHKQFDRAVDICNEIAPTSVTTNGSLIAKWALPLSKLKGVTVSVMSLKDRNYQEIMGTQSHVKAALNSIERLVAAGTNVHINCVLTRQNQDEVEDIIETFSGIGVSEVKFLSILEAKPGDAKLYVPLEGVGKRLEQKYGAPEVTGSTKVGFRVNELTKAVLVYQYCSVGCDVCKVEGFMRIDPLPALSYCLAAEPISIAEEAAKKDIAGLRAKLKLAMNGMGKPTGYTYKLEDRRKNPINTGLLP